MTAVLLFSLQQAAFLITLFLGFLTFWNKIVISFLITGTPMEPMLFEKQPINQLTLSAFCIYVIFFFPMFFFIIHLM